MKPKQEDQKEMVGGCCVCSDENGWTENPLVYCDGQGCNVAVHQACYGIVTVPTGSWFCRKCESQERAARVRCELCPSKDGALKRTDSGGWAHVVCALYIPEVRFGNVTTMEPIMLQLVPPERFNKTCYICEENSKGNGGSNKAQMGACMQCNRQGCKNNFHVTCAQALGLLCEEAGNYLDNVKYCGYCSYHYSKLLNTFHKKGSTVKTIPPYRPVKKDTENNSSDEDINTGPKTLVSENCDKEANNIAESSVDSTAESKDIKQKKRLSKHSSNLDSKNLTRDVKPTIGEPSVSSKPCSSSSGSCVIECVLDSSDISSAISSNSALGAIKSEPKSSSSEQLNNSLVPNLKSSGLASSLKYNASSSSLLSFETSPGSATSLSSNSHTPCLSASAVVTNVSLDSGVVSTGPSTSTSSCVTVSSQSLNTSDLTSITESTSQIAKTVVTTFPSNVSSSSRTKSLNFLPISSSSQDKEKDNSSASDLDKEKDKQRKMRRNGSKPPLAKVLDADTSMSTEEESPTKEGILTICEEKNLSVDVKDKINKGKNSPDDIKLNVQFTPNVSVTGNHNKTFTPLNSESSNIGEPAKRSRSNSQDRGRRNKRGGGACGISKRGRILNLSKEQNIKEQQDSEASSPESFTDIYPPPKRARTKKLEIKDIKEPLTISSILTNGMATNALLLGNQINPSSAVAQKMQDTLHAEIEAHSIYKDEEKVALSLVGPALPGKRETSTPGAVLNSTQPPPLPQSLEQLLERQWEQGSQFLMEQAQHFDIASLLSCLHQLRQENVRLEETVSSLIARRDHLLAVNARLSVPLTSTLAANQSPTSGTTQSSASSMASSLVSHPSSLATSIVSITPTGSSTPLSASALGVSSQINQLRMSSQLLSSGNVSSLTNAMVPRPHSQGRPPSGGNLSHPSMSAASGGRGTSPHDRRGGQQGPPMENGLGEPEYRYRSPGSGIEHQHRQQSPMLPPGAQPSPTSLRQSPASSNYHPGTSPHTGMPTLSPSGISHGIPPHTLVAHATSHGQQHPVMVSSSLGPGSQHNISLSRGSEHARAELVRLSLSSQPQQQHPNPNLSGYPTYQMVSPPVPGQHHSPVTMSQHPPPQHTQVMRRETVVDTSRGNHSNLEKR